MHTQELIKQILSIREQKDILDAREKELRQELNKEMKNLGENKVNADNATAYFSTRKDWRIDDKVFVKWAEGYGFSHLVEKVGKKNAIKEAFTQDEDLAITDGGEIVPGVTIRETEILTVKEVKGEKA